MPTMGYRTKRDLESLASWRPYGRRRTKRVLALWATIILIVYIICDSFGLLPSRGSAVNVAFPRTRDEKEMLTAEDGKVELPWLYDTLVHVNQAGRNNRDRHVLFAASTMKSIATLAGLACEMDRGKRNIVHLMFLGRTDVPVEFLKKAHGIINQEGGCDVHVHDGRPDFPSRSDDGRMALGTTAAVKYAMRYISPRAILVDQDGEDAWFTKAIKASAKKMQVTLIELPKETSSRMPWVTRLDGGALESWHKPKVDIVVQADGWSGNIISLLKSLRDADYFGLEPPRLRIELDPSSVAPHIRKFISKFEWPAKEKLIIWHRLLSKNDEKTRSLNMIESFYPGNSDTAVLILDPSVEVSKFYFHWLTFATLDYKYAREHHAEAESMCGIALTQPLGYLSGSEPFNPWSLPQEDKKPFLYSAPSQHACLIFGDYWAEFHEYASRRMKAMENTSSKAPDYRLPFPMAPQGSMPFWYTNFLELVTARSYLTLYPRYNPATEALAIIHADKPTRRRTKQQKQQKTQQTLMTLVNSITTSLPEGELPPLHLLDMLDYKAEKTYLVKLSQVADDYKKQMVAGCTHRSEEVKRFEVDDLFCDENVVMTSRDDAD